MQLSKENLFNIQHSTVLIAPVDVFALPEKVLQFGTGVLLRGLPDYFIDKANRNNIFNGRVVAVKTTSAGSASDFTEQNNLYTLCIRGLTDGNIIEENIICASINRVLSASDQWTAVLNCAKNPQLKIIISNTTEVGIQLVKESIFQHPPASFPAKLLAFLYERYKSFGDDEQSELVVLPTELISDNGKKLKSIVIALIAHNNLEEEFLQWFSKRISFCNTLVDCIVPGKPNDLLAEKLNDELGYTDNLLAITEVYRLWAIEGDDKIKSLLSFAEADNRIIITPDITKYKELKLRLLNGTHTLSCGLCYLAGVRTVKEAMEDVQTSAYISNLMLTELAPAIPYEPALSDAEAFGHQVLDRFKNPFLDHQWLSISMQYTSKMAMRTISVLLQYYKLYNKVPGYYVLGFAAYLLFMKAVKKENEKYYGQANDRFYVINDDNAGYYFDIWQSNPVETIVEIILKNEQIWGTDLSGIHGLQDSLIHHLKGMMKHGVKETLHKFLLTGR